MKHKTHCMMKHGEKVLTWSCCCFANSICWRCFSICEAASFFCSSWAASSCSLRLLSCVIIPISWRSFSARLSGVPVGVKGHRPQVKELVEEALYPDVLLLRCAIALVFT